MNKKTMVATLAVVTVLRLGVSGATSAFAQTTTQQNHMTSLVQKIASKFGLKEADVQSVFDEDHKALQAERQAQYETRLTQLVTDGKITEDQKKLLLAKHAELQSTREANRGSMQNMTNEQRKTKRDEERTALEAWAKQNGIDMQYLMLGRGMGHGGWGLGMKNSQ